MGSFARPSLARIVFIDRAIRAGGWPNAATLARELEVSPRTVQRDIILMGMRRIGFQPVLKGYLTDEQHWSIFGGQEFHHAHDWQKGPDDVR